jgi:hypothetical protein
MRRSLYALAAIVVMTGGAAAYLLLPRPAAAQAVMLYKNPQCGCCEAYADYLRRYGFTVTVKPTHDLAAMSRGVGLADDVQGCHLSMIETYAVSGHVPVDVIRRLLGERPDIKALTLPGMPQGSPGMGGTKAAPFEILQVSQSGVVTGVYARR